jgi:tRNA C32,U32 (ribose-2'-O)-methylase TrmJ
MEASGFHHHEAGDPTATAVKNMMRRIQMSEREMRIMLALFNRVRITLGRSRECEHETPPTLLRRS